MIDDLDPTERYYLFGDGPARLKAWSGGPTSAELLAGLRDPLAEERDRRRKRLIARIGASPNGESRLARVRRIELTGYPRSTTPAT